MIDTKVKVNGKTVGEYDMTPTIPVEKLPPEVPLMNDDKKIPQENLPDLGLEFSNSASVGQYIKVNEVDENGKPISWEPCDLDLSNCMTLDGDQKLTNKHLQGYVDFRQSGQKKLFPCVAVGYQSPIGHGIVLHPSTIGASPVGVFNVDSEDTANLKLISPLNPSTHTVITHNKISLQNNGFYVILSANKSGISEGSSQVPMIALSGYGNAGIIIRGLHSPAQDTDAATKAYVDAKVSDKELVLASSTEGSSKKFKITVDDSGTISATEITE